MNASQSVGVYRHITSSNRPSSYSLSFSSILCMVNIYYHSIIRWCVQDAHGYLVETKTRHLFSQSFQCTLLRLASLLGDILSSVYSVMPVDWSHSYALSFTSLHTCSHWLHPYSFRFCNPLKRRSIYPWNTISGWRFVDSVVMSHIACKCCASAFHRVGTPALIT